MSICIWARAFEALARRTPCLIYLAAVLRPGAPPLAAERRAQRTVVRGALGACPGSSTSSGTVRDFVAAPRPRGRWATLLPRRARYSPPSRCSCPPQKRTDFEGRGWWSRTRTLRADEAAAVVWHSSQRNPATPVGAVCALWAAPRASYQVPVCVVPHTPHRRCALLPRAEEAALAPPPPSRPSKSATASGEKETCAASCCARLYMV